MDLQRLAEHGRNIEYLMEGKGSFQVDRAFESVIATQDWDLVGHLLLTASEVSTQRFVRKLLELEVYEPLVWAACLRRQPRRPGEGARAGGVSHRVFRDWDAEEGGAGIPDHIQADAEEMAKTADQTRAAAMVRAAEVDRDPVRHNIVNGLADKMAASPAAVDAMLVIARASAWDETRRDAAMKIANNGIAVARLARELRSADLIAVAEASGLSAVASTLAKALGAHVEQLKAAGDMKGLEFVAQHHPTETGKAVARQALGR